MKNLLLNELNRMKYLANHERGVVISEQKRILKENDEPTFDDLVWNLQNNRLKDFKFDIGRSSIHSGDSAYVAVIYERNLIFLQKEPKNVFVLDGNAKKLIGTWSWYENLSSPFKWKWEPKITINQKEKETTRTTSDDTGTKIVRQKRRFMNVKGKLPSPIDTEISTAKVENNELIFEITKNNIEIISPVTGTIEKTDPNYSWIEFFFDVSIYEFGMEVIDTKNCVINYEVTVGQKVVKGQKIGTITCKNIDPKNPSIIKFDVTTTDNDKLNPMEWFKLQ